MASVAATDMLLLGALTGLLLLLFSRTVVLMLQDLAAATDEASSTTLALLSTRHNHPLWMLRQPRPKPRTHPLAP
jgi:hypothetical protein